VGNGQLFIDYWKPTVEKRERKEGTRTIPSFSTPKGDATCTREVPSAKTRKNNNNRTHTTRQSAIGKWDRRKDRRKTVVRRREERYTTALRWVRVHAHTQIKRTFHFIPISAVAHLELFSTFFFLYRWKVIVLDSCSGYVHYTGIYLPVSFHFNLTWLGVKE